MQGTQHYQWACLLLILAIGVTAVKVDPENSLFVDQYGRYRIYHGVNAVYKIHPFHPNLVDFDTNYSLTTQDLFHLKKWGMNVIRLHCAWEGVEPQRDHYNYTYIETLQKIVRQCNDYGISVILDAHQDLYVKQFCGQGLPTWTAKRESFPFPLPVKLRYDDQGFPLLEDCLKVQPFGKFYLTRDIMRLQRDLFTNQRGLLDHFAKFWQTIAAYMASEPNLLGYEIINQPIGTDIYRSPEHILPGQLNDLDLLPAYRRIYQAIRKQDPNKLVFFEPSVADIFNGGFSDTPGGEQEREKQVLSYHIYCPDVTSEGQPKSASLCKVFDELSVAGKEQNIKSMKIGGILSEYGALSGTPKSAAEVTSLTDMMSDHFRSWTYWQFKYYHDITTAANPGTTESFYDENGELQTEKVKALARPYATAICGIPLKETWKKGIFTLKWVGHDDCFNQFTELFLSQEFHFSKGVVVHFSNNCKGCLLQQISEESSGNYYRIRLSPSAINHKITLSVSDGQ